MLGRRKGFTLIELLVVIAIIGILAAMLFPVFARARESARKTQCLSNVKNIAMAYQMYLTDYDRFMPSEHRADVHAWFDSRCGCGSGRQCCTDRVAQANPYLKVPVILDEYIKNRDVWKCPSAQSSSTWAILNPYLSPSGTDDWFGRFLWSQDQCPHFRSCGSSYPPGWGGAVTDTITNGVWCNPPTGSGAFEMSIGYNIGVGGEMYDMSTSQVDDPARWVVCGDGGANKACAIVNTSSIAFPDVCRVNRQGCQAQCGPDWVNCPSSQSCSLVPRSEEGGIRFATDPSYRKQFTRHLGGSNIGFADGHAKWMDAEAILFGGEAGSGYEDKTYSLHGVQCCFVAEKTY